LVSSYRGYRHRIFKILKVWKEYANNIFVGDTNKTRNGLKFDNSKASESRLISDFVAHDKSEISISVTFGTGFGGITDIYTGPDGLLYVLSYGNGSIYRIEP
jgi:glucose/arabinose dehydrogenase